jgi:hypothetical protein
MLTFTAPIERIRYKKKGSYENRPPWRYSEYVAALREYCFMLKLEGLTHRQIGHRLGLHAQDVSRLQRAYKKAFAAKFGRSMRRCRFVVTTHD